MLCSQNLKPYYLFSGEAVRNELVLRVQPGEAVYVKVMTKTPGMSFLQTETHTGRLGNLLDIDNLTGLHA